MLSRTLEPEVMDTPEEALAYDTMDHSEVNRLFVDDFLAAAKDPVGDVLDLGTGTAQIPVELCQRDELVRVVAIDLSSSMLDIAKGKIEIAGLTERIRLDLVDGKGLPYEDNQFAAVMSNSIVHHIPEPASVLAEAWRVLAPGGILFIRDLLRPETAQEVDRLVAKHAAGSDARQRGLFKDSLHAALTLAEVRELLVPLAIPVTAAQQTSDRHWTLIAVKPAESIALLIDGLGCF